MIFQRHHKALLWGNCQVKHAWSAIHLATYLNFCLCLHPSVDLESFVRGGPTLTFFFVCLFFRFFFFFDEGREDPNTTKTGYHRLARETPFNGAPILNAGLVALCCFRGSGPVFLRNPKFL